MRVSKLLRVVLCMLPFVIAPAVAQAIPVSIQINGTTVSSANCTTSGITTTCTIAGTYGNVIVTDQGGTAQVVAVNDATLPTLSLNNAKFKASANAVNGSVTFSATPTAGINGPMMARVASGWLVRVENVSAPYNSSTNRGQFIVDGVVTSTDMNPSTESIDGISSGGDTSGSSKVVLSTAFAYGEIKATTFTKTETMGMLLPPPSGTLKGEFTFYLPNANDFLRLTEVKVETRNPGTPDSDLESLASVGYTSIWDDDTARCKKHKKLCPGEACPIVKGPLDKHQ